MTLDQAAPALSPATEKYEKSCSAGTVSVQMSNRFGKLHLFASNDGCTSIEDFVAVYKDRLPADPNEHVAWKYVKEFGQPWDTGQNWGPGFIAAYVSRDYRRGMEWKYVCSTEVIPPND